MSGDETMSMLRWLSLGAGLTLAVAAAGHDGQTDASGCHGREVAGFEHCHVESVRLGETESRHLDLRDARRGARRLDVPGCITCPDIAALPSRLLALGHRPGPVDGILGPRTRAAIRSYQRAEGLVVDGRASEALLEHIGLGHP